MCGSFYALGELIGVGVLSNEACLLVTNRGRIMSSSKYALVSEEISLL